MILGHIGVRAGSKGVPGKNFRPLCGKPLLDWSLDQLLGHPRIDAVVVSTDDPEMYAHSVAKGTLPMGLRPAELATDGAGKFGVWQHALSVCEGLVDGEITCFIDVDVTSPLRTDADIDGALDLYFRERPDMVLVGCEARTNPYFNLLETDETGALHVTKPLPGGVVARQQAPKVYEHSGTYVLRPDYLREAHALFDGRVIPYEIPAERSHDIDSELDFKVVELMMQERLAGRL